MSDLARGQLIKDDEILERPGGSVGRGREQLGERTAVGQQDEAREDRREEGRPDGAHDEGPPAAPADLGTKDPDNHAADRRPDQEVRVPLAAKDQAGVVKRPGQGQAQQEHQADGQPALGRSEWEASIHAARTSPSGRPGVIM